MRGPEVPLMGIDCWNHPGRVAEGVCLVCGKPVCLDCSRKVSRGLLCEDPEHKLVLEAWALVGRPKSEFESDMIVRNLELQNIPTRAFSSRVYRLNIGEDVSDVVQVFVRQEMIAHAESVLSNLGLSTSENNHPKSIKEGPGSV